MNKLAFLQNQTIELQHLLETAGDDPILAPQLRERLEDAQNELDEARRQEGTLLPKEPIVLPRTAIFLKGQSVQDSEGIRPSLAGEAMIQYERMFIQQALHDEREAARQAGRHRRRRGSATPALLFTGTPRGSFGLEFTPQPTDETAVHVHAQSLRNVSNALALVAESEFKAFDEIVKQIPTGVLHHLKSFMGTLAQHGAEIRLAYSDRPSQWLSAEKIQTAAALLEKDFVQGIEKVSGTFRGVTLESGKFDLKTDSGEVITGTVADQLTEEDLVRISSLTNHPCMATLEKTTVSTIAGAATTTYVLLDAQAVADADQPKPRRTIDN
jgi:hypothetical protein